MVSIKNLCNIIALFTLGLSTGTGAQTVPDACSIYKQACTDIALQFPPPTGTTASTSSNGAIVSNGWNAFLLSCSVTVQQGNPSLLLNGFCGFCPSSTGITDPASFANATASPPASCRIGAIRSLAGTVFYKFGRVPGDDASVTKLKDQCTQAACRNSDPAIGPLAADWMLFNATTAVIGQCSCRSDALGEYYEPDPRQFNVPGEFGRAAMYNSTVVVPTTSWPTGASSTGSATTATVTSTTATSTTRSNSARKAGCMLGLLVPIILLLAA
ncbi:hypothetical protein HDU96_006378 [Phlyctochytrium bullatum]|nr:hypothetical protein HDU96_006378 [Phlyctochytrium bullatum]